VSKTKTGRESAYERIREMVLNGEIESGIIITVSELAERLRLGKSPVRDAILKLGEEGYVQIMPRKGLLFKSLKGKDIKNIYQLREAIELYAIGIFVDEYDKNLKKCLEDLISRQIECASGNEIEKFMELDEKFHSTIVASLGNDLMDDTIRDIRRKLFHFGITSITKHKNIEEAVEEHKNILIAIEERDRDKSRKLLGKHIFDAYHNILSQK